MELNKLNTCVNKTKTIVFFGHSYINQKDIVNKRLCDIVEKYIKLDYKNFLIHEDSQVLHEGTRVLGYQRELIKNPAKLFQIK